MVIEFSKAITHNNPNLLDEKVKGKIKDLAYCLENVNLGYFMHNLLDSTIIVFRMNIINYTNYFKI